MPKAKNSSPEKESDLPFEKALTQLEDLVREMESDELPLEELIGKYELGTQLHRACEKRLDEAQGRIEMIRKKRNGETVVEPFDDNAESAPVEETNDTQKHGELF